MMALSGDTQPCWTVTSNCSRFLSLSSFHHLTILRYGGGMRTRTHTYARGTITNTHTAPVLLLKAHTYTKLPHLSCPLAKHTMARTIFPFNLPAPHLCYRLPLRLHPNDVSSQLGHSEQDVGWRKETKCTNRRCHVLFLSCDSWQLRSQAWVMSC